MSTEILDELTPITDAHETFDQDSLASEFCLENRHNQAPFAATLNISS
jgi:hypothetical protein